MNIVITGASQGIGYELAKRLSADQQHKILAVSRNLEALVKLQFLCREQYGNDIIILNGDITSEEFRKELVKEAEKLAGVDILVNNAGLLINKMFKEMEDVDFDRMFSVNVKAPFNLIQQMLPLFNKPAHVVNIGSMGGFQGSAKFPGLSLYSASKGALAILTECLAEELKELDIRLNCLALGSAQTEMLTRAFPGYQSPLTAEQMAEFIADFALNGHRFFNGKVLPVALSTP